MKASGFLELILILVFMVAGLPLLVQFMYTIEADKMTYLDDKTIYELPATLEVKQVGGETIVWTGSADYYHTTLNIAAAVLIPAVQDDYCPFDGYFIRYPDTLLRDGEDLILQKGWRGVRYDKINSIISLLGTAERAANVNNVYAMRWDPDYYNGEAEGRWIIFKIKP